MSYEIHPTNSRLFYFTQPSGQKIQKDSKREEENMLDCVKRSKEMLKTVKEAKGLGCPVGCDATTMQTLIDAIDTFLS